MVCRKGEHLGLDHVYKCWVYWLLIPLEKYKTLDILSHRENKNQVDYMHSDIYHSDIMRYSVSSQKTGRNASKAILVQLLQQEDTSR